MFLLKQQKMRLRGIEPPHAAPEATALSTELQTHYTYNTTIFTELQEGFIDFLLTVCYYLLWKYCHTAMGRAWPFVPGHGYGATAGMGK